MVKNPISPLNIGEKSKGNPGKSTRLKKQLKEFYKGIKSSVSFIESQYSIKSNISHESTQSKVAFDQQTTLPSSKSPISPLFPRVIEEACDSIASSKKSPRGKNKTNPINSKKKEG